MKSKVKAKWVIKISENSRVLVKEKDRVKKGEKLLISGLKEIKYVDLSSVLVKVSQNKLDELNRQWTKLQVNEGDLLYETGGFFSKKIVSPFSGLLDGVNEFFNLKVEVKSDEFKEVYSPVDAKVNKVEKDKLVLEFEAIEMEGNGIGGGKGWGEGLVKVNGISDLNSLLTKKIVIMPKLAQSLVTKAEVVGVKGIITSESNDESISLIETALPILVLTDEQLENLTKYCEKDMQIMINSKIGRLLLVERE